VRKAAITRFARDTRGATLLEFALLTPVMLMMIMGLGDLLYQAYTQSILTGAFQKAGRDSGLEGGTANTATIDKSVIAAMAPIVKNLSYNCAPSGTAATWCTTRKNYDTFSEVAPEPFVDTNGNGIRDPGECFTDENGNGSWDTDPGNDGQGGASAVILYTMTITYPRIFPVAGLFKWPKTQTISASTLLKNQPYASQTTTNNVTICT
jgi:Flp pilus assembly protein TadG